MLAHTRSHGRSAPVPASKKQQLATAKRRAQAVELRLAGLTFQQIADQLGYSGRDSARIDIDRAYEAMVIERNHNLDVLKEEQLAILARMRRAVWPAAIQGDTKAVDIVLKIVDRTSKLLGLDPSLHVSLEMHTVDALDRQIRELTEQIQLEGGQYEWSDVGDVVGSVQALPAGEVEEASG